MKTTLLTVVAGLFCTTLSAQDKKDLQVSFSAGAFNSPYYTNDIHREFYNIDFDYFISKRHIISSSFMSGHHRYFDDVLSNNAVPITRPGYEDNANATADYLTFSVMYKYKILSDKKLSLNIGAGAGIMTQTKTYPFTDGNSVDFRESGWTDLVFPVRAELDYRFAKHFLFGFITGLYIHPDFPVLGVHLGPRLSYLIK
jgi:hypothetical protein